MECAFNNVYTTKYGVVEQCNQNCGGNSDASGGGGGVDLITIIIIAVTISLTLGCCGYAYYRRKRGKAEDGDSSQGADKGKVHCFDQSDTTAPTEISGKVRTEATISTASINHGIQKLTVFNS
jgi:hypothetical protein